MANTKNTKNSAKKVEVKQPETVVEQVASAAVENFLPTSVINELKSLNHRVTTIVDYKHRVISLNLFKPKEPDFDIRMEVVKMPEGSEVKITKDFYEQNGKEGWRKLHAESRRFTLADADAVFKQLVADLEKNNVDVIR